MDVVCVCMWHGEDADVGETITGLLLIVPVLPPVGLVAITENVSSHSSCRPTRNIHPPTDILLMSKHTHQFTH